MVRFEVAQFLYTGLAVSLERLERSIEQGAFDQFDKQRFADLKVAFEWYEGNCALSSKFLREKIEEIEKKLILLNNK